MELFLIDGIGPFFRSLEKQKINWSKIPFEHLQIDTDQRRTVFDRIGADLDIFAGKVSQIGYNAVTLDDVAHLAPDPWLESRINLTIEDFREEYRRFFAILSSHGLKVYLTMDVLSFTPGLKAAIGGSKTKAAEFLIRQVESVFSSFEEVSGIILRIGECDGNDVKGDFKSELFLKTATDVNALIHRLLPVFERHKRNLILRTWTIGAYRVGDLIWHRRTISRVLQNIDSDHFILSMKYGESDFFRYLPLNKHFFTAKVKKIIELQARREYEGCGEYPSFIGWDYRDYADQLQQAEQMAGISVWCQTGGWVPFRRLSYLDEEAVWNELNSFVTIKIFRENHTVAQAVQEFGAQAGWGDHDAVLEFLKLNDSVIKSLLYIKEIASQKLFFRRIRIPPLLTVYWNNIFINHSIRVILLSLIEDPDQTVAEGREALTKLKNMKKIARDTGLPVADIEFMEDTFKIIALARNYYFLADEEMAQNKLKKAKRRYKKNYPRSLRPRYRIKTSYHAIPRGITQFTSLMRFALRTKRGYRLVDYLITIHLLGTFYRLLVWINPKVIPKFARKQAMGIGAIFR